jgi:hypothetical protein
MQKKLMIVGEDDTEILARIACTCGSTDHDAEILFEVNKDWGPYGFSMHISTDLAAHDYSEWHKNPLVRFWWTLKWRVRNAAKLLFNGRVEAHYEMLLDADNIHAFETAITMAKQKFTDASTEVKA